MRIRPSSLLLPFLMVAALPQLGCGDEAQSKTPEPEDVEAAVPVEAAFVERGPIHAVFAGTATLEAEDEAAVVARAGGVVKAVFAEEGQYVEAGQPLVQLDDERLALELRRAEVTLENLRLEYERNQELFNKKLVSAEAFERVKSEFQLQQQVRDIANLDLEFTTVRAPINGIISRRAVKVGNMIQQNEVTYHITDFDPLLAVMHVPERELHKLEVGQRATIIVDALPEGRFDGFVKRISPVVDAATGTFKVTVEVGDRSRRLKPGMFGRVHVVHDTHESALLVPKSAVVREDDQASIYVVRDSVSYRVPIVLGYENDRSIEVISGITEGDTIVVTGQGGLRDSSRVETIEI